MKLQGRSVLRIALMLLVAAAAMPSFAQRGGEATRRGTSGGRIHADLKIAPQAITFYGNFSYYFSGTTAVLKADNVANSNATATGPLRFSLMFTTTPYPSSGFNTAQYPITNSLAAGATISPVNGAGTTVPFTLPPAGCYWVTLVLEEQVSGTWQQRDYGSFSLSIDSGGGCITSFSAAPSTIAAGGSSTLSWSLIGTATPSIDNGIGAQPQNGSKSVTPSATTTYTLSANNTANGVPPKKFATVTVSVPAPVINSFTATPSTITAGQSSTLSWSTSNATSCTISGVTGTQPVNGSVSVTPNATTTYTLTASNGSQQVTRTATVTVNAALPSISGLFPNHGPAAGGTTVVISGGNLSGATSVTFGGSAAALGANTGATLTVTTPAHAAGGVSVVVTTPAGTASALYTYDAANAPSIASITPNVGPTAGGQTVTINGSNFGSGNVVTFDSTPATIVNATSTALIVLTPPHAPGKVTVAVTMTSGSASGNYTYSDDGTMRVISVVGSTAGSFGSFFRTSMQLHNDGNATVAGNLVFHPSGSPASANDPSMAFSIAPGQTQSIDDLVAALHASGVGSLDIDSDGVSSLLLGSRIYNDAGAAGTTGMGIDPESPDNAIQQGDSGILVAPANTDSFRFNIGVRTMSFGATLQVSLYAANGTLRNQTTKTYGANLFAQTSAADFAGVAPAANETIIVNVTAGSAFVYGSITDNKTQDPTYEAAKSLAALRARGQVAKLVIPVVGSAAGSFGSYFRTSVQLHNAGTSTITGSLIFHPAGASASPSDPSVPYSLTAGQTTSISDVVASMNTSGIGSLDITSSDFTSLLASARIYNDAGVNGTTGMGIDPLAPSDALQPGSTGVLLAPAHTDVFRYNIGLRTLDDGVSMQITVLDAGGHTKQTVTKSFGPNYFSQFGASDFLGTPVSANDAILISINSGAVFVYGSTTDNRTQDPTYALAQTE